MKLGIVVFKGLLLAADDKKVNGCIMGIPDQEQRHFLPCPTLTIVQEVGSENMRFFILSLSYSKDLPTYLDSYHQTKPDQII